MATPGVTGVSHLSDDTQKVFDHYSKFYDKEADKRTKEREESAADITQSFYELVTDFYEFGYGESFHFAPIYDNMTMAECIAMFEREIAETLQAKPGMKILDIGCGVGGPARTFSKFCGANVIGLNISDYQVKRARLLTAAANLQETVSFMKGDFANMDQIEDNSMDGVYALESTCHARDILKVYKEVYRVLKPGALFVESAWALTEKFQPENPEHEKIKHQIILGNGLPDLRSKSFIIDKMQEAGLELVEKKDCSFEGDLPWDIFLVGKSCLSMQSFRASWLGRTITHYTLSALETVHLVPSGTTKVHSVLITAADGLTASRKAGIFTPSFRVVLRKPVE